MNRKEKKIYSDEIKKRKLKSKRIPKEAQFEKDLKTVAAILKCAYFKIPDTKMITAQNRRLNREKKRPFDGILITPECNYCIECKIDYGELKPHQKINQQIVNTINGTFYVFRKVFLKTGIEYRISYNGETFYRTPNIEDLIKYFI